MAERMIRALMVEPGRHPHGVWLPLSYEGLRNAIEGDVTNFCAVRVREVEPGIYVLYNDEGVPFDLPGNRHVGKMVFCGVFYVIAADEKGCVVSLSNDTLRRYQRLLWEPERIPYQELVQAYMDDALRQLDEIEFSDLTDIYY